jgi:hypothetical protein
MSLLINRVAGAGQPRARSGTRSGTHRPAEPRPGVAPATALRSDRSVTPSRVLPLRRNAGVTV